MSHSLFQQLAQLYAAATIEHPQLKPVTLAQWMLESGRGTSALARLHLNFGGLKWRDEMHGYARPTTYQAHDGVAEYCHFSSLEAFIAGYWRFIERAPYRGHRLLVNNPRAWLGHVGPIYCPAHRYVKRVLELVPEATALLEAYGYGSEPVTAFVENNASVPAPTSPPASAPALSMPKRQTTPASKSRYRVTFYTGSYRSRQLQANADGAVCYAEQHFNSAGPAADGAEAIVATNASETSKSWGRDYARAVSEEFDIPLRGDRGIVVGGYRGRGNSNLKFTAMPAILLEPLFCSNPDHAQWIRGADHAHDRLACVLADSIRAHFPQGGLVAFSIGHKGKPSHPVDRGAAVVGGGWEADYAEVVLHKAAALLAAG